MYKMIAIDIDDTLLNDDLQVTQTTMQALKKAADEGVFITLATGRMFASAKQVANQIDLNVPLITYQGSLIKNLKDETVIYERFVPEDVVAYLFDFCVEHQLHIQTYYEDRLYVLEDNEKIKNYVKQSNVPYHVETDVEKLKHTPAIKIVIIDDPDKLDQLALKFKPKFGNKVHITKSKPYYLEFLHPEGNKGSALRFLAETFQCPQDQTIAVGDSWNDREMIEYAGLGVAMGNAVQELKDIANYITLTNNENGVAHVIEKFILNEKK